MRKIRKRNVQKKKRFSLNAILWLIVIIIIIFLTVFNIKDISKILPEFFSKEQTKKLEKPNLTKTAESAQEKDLEVSLEPTKEQGENTVDDTPEHGSEEMHDAVSSYVYFVKIHDDGSFSLIKRMRSIEKTKAVLTKTLAMLMQGTTSEEEHSGIKSFIPQSSIVKSISVKNGVAYVNMSAEFRFNSFGRTALEAQIYQLVYTSTEFSTINKVQILIDGKTVRYLSGEGGLFLGSPLSRRNLSSSLYRK